MTIWTGGSSSLVKRPREKSRSKLSCLHKASTWDGTRWWQAVETPPASRSYSDNPYNMPGAGQKWINSTSQRRKQCPHSGVQLRPDSGWSCEGPATRDTESTKTVFWGGRKNGEKGRGTTLEHLGRRYASRKMYQWKGRKWDPAG